MEAWQLSGDPEYARIVDETLTYLMRDMSSEEGAFYAATDADSPTGEGHKEEGAFFLWTPEEVETVLTDEQAELVKAYYDITEAGNFEGSNILHTPKSRDAVAGELGISRETFDRRLERARKKMYLARDRRPHPHHDQNILAGWNGLALEAFSRAALVFDNQRWLRRARSAGDFIVEELRDEKGRLLRNVTFWEAGTRAYASDYAFVIAGLLGLYEATQEPRWLQAAVELQNGMLEDYWDGGSGGFYQTPDGSDSLLGRKKPDYDGASPSANSYAALNLLKLYQFTLNERYQRQARELFEAFGPSIERRGPGMTQMLVALDFLDAKPREIAMIRPQGSSDAALMNMYRKRFLPNGVLVRASAASVPERAGEVPWLEKKEAKDGKATAYVCRDFTCKYPTNDPEKFGSQIADVTPIRGE